MAAAPAKQQASAALPPFPKHLVAACRKGNVVLVFGSGFSVSLAGWRRELTWTGLLESGIEKCLRFGKDQGWADEQKRIMSQPDGVLTVASNVTKHLQGQQNQHVYEQWLEAAFDHVQCRNVAAQRVLKRFMHRGALFTTTNYDGLLEDATGMRPIHRSDVDGINAAVLAAVRVLYSVCNPQLRFTL